MGFIKNEIKFAIIYVIVPILVGLILIKIAFDNNVNFVFVKYRYTGEEVLSFFGLLDTSHYRYKALNEFFGWQFFWGNFQIFVVFAILMAAFFHLFRFNLLKNNTPEKEQYEQLDNDIALKKLKKMGLTAGIISVFIILIEILISIIGNPEVGLGSPIYINSYAQSIPELLNNGYYTINNLPYYSQIFVALFPIIFGFGAFFYLHGLKSFQRRSLISFTNNEKGFRTNSLGWILLFVGLFYYNILAIEKEINLTSLATSFTAYMSIVFILNAMFTTSFVLLIIRWLIRGKSVQDGRYKFNSTAFKVFFITLLGVLLLGATFLLPYTNYLGLDFEIESSFLWTFQKFLQF